MSLQQFKGFLEDNDIIFHENEPLSEHCTFAIGGAAAFFVEPANEEQVSKVIIEAKKLGIKYFVLGNGSNVLFSDDGYNGMIIHPRHGFTDIRLIDDCTIECESGATIKDLTKFALGNSLTGLEFAYGIPGSVGGGVYMNAGAYDGEMKNVLTETFHIDEDGKLGSFTGENMALSYRHSAYTEKNYIITKSHFALQKGNFAEIKNKMDDFMSRRHDKQPLELPSAGSTFKRPKDGYASALIDQCGLKGRKIGGAMVSEKHAGFVVNVGHATCKDVLDLISFVISEVKAKTGIELEPEVKVINP